MPENFDWDRLTGRPASDWSQDDREKLTAALSMLSPYDREILTLRYLEGLRNVEAAERLGLTQQAVSIRLKRARERLRKRLGTGD